jgi:bifunctional non-homologous end joining protein LigD
MAVLLYTFDLLALEGVYLRDQPLIERKRRLRAIMPRMKSRLVYADHIDGRGKDFFRAICERDLEGIVGKWRRGRYSTNGTINSWVKIKIRTTLK